MEQTTLPRHPYLVNDLALSADNKMLAACSGRAVHLWNVPLGKSLGILPPQGKGAMTAAFIGDSTRLATACSEGTVKLWGEPILRPQTTLEGHGPLACSADGLLLAFAGKDNAIVLAETNTGTAVASLRGTERAVPLLALTFAPDGKTLLAGCSDGTLQFWDVPSRQLRKSLKAHALRVSALACIGEGPTVISASQDETVKFWDLATGKELRTLRGHTGWVHALALTRDGRTLATGSADKTILLWDAATGQLQATLRGHRQAVTSLVFASDSQMLISGSKDGTIKIWSVK
jgi:WD40 repeat protein